MLAILTSSPPSSAQTEWDGFPLAANTNARTWWMADQAYQPVSQLWYAVVERALITGGENDGETYVDLMTAFNGITGGIYYTTIDIGRTNAIAPDPANNETSWIGPATNTVNGTNYFVYPYLTGEFLAFLTQSLYSRQNIDGNNHIHMLKVTFVASHAIGMINVEVGEYAGNEY